MSGLRDWSNEGGTPEEHALVAASRSEGAPSSTRSRTLAALGVGALVTATTVTATTTATAAGTASGVGLGVVAKIAGVVLFVSGVTAFGLAWQRSRNAEPRPMVTAAVTAADLAPAANTAAPEEAPESAPPPAVPSGQGALVARSHVAPASSSASLSKEVAALEKAHAAIAAHDPDSAIRALDRYRAQFPGGALGSEEAVLRVQAMVARGDKSNARELADTFRATHPDSPYGRGVQDLVSNKASKP